MHGTLFTEHRDLILKQEGTTVAADANPFTVTGLSANTDYDLYVQADCGSGDLSYWSSSVSVTTDCEAVKLTSIHREL